MVVSRLSSVGLRLEVIALCALLTWVEQVTGEDIAFNKKEIQFISNQIHLSYRRKESLLYAGYTLYQSSRAN